MKTTANIKATQTYKDFHDTEVQVIRNRDKLITGQNTNVSQSEIDRLDNNLLAAKSKERTARMELSKLLFEEAGIKSPLVRLVTSQTLERCREYIIKERTLKDELKAIRKRVADIGIKVQSLEKERSQDFAKFSASDRARLDELYLQADREKNQIYTKEIELQKLQDLLHVEKAKLINLVMNIFEDVQAVRNNLLFAASEADQEFRFLMAELQGVIGVQFGLPESKLKFHNIILPGIPNNGEPDEDMIAKQKAEGFRKKVVSQ